jgi:HAD superfamily hydrolase (TIGR01509 family)
MLKGVIFDMDGVLANSHPVHERAWKALLVSIGKFVSKEDLDFIRQGRKRQDIVRYFLGDLPDDEVRALGEKKDLLFQREEVSIRTIAGVRELLGELRHAAIPLAVASCGTRARVRHLLEVLQIGDYFDVVFTGDDVPLGKPDPAIFVKVSEQLGLGPAELLVFEDSVSGVFAANAAGMKTVGIGEAEHANGLLEAGALHALPNFVGVSVSMLRQLFN